MSPDLLPTLNLDPGSGITIGAFFGFLLALPVSLFLAYWLTSVKNRFAVVTGAFAGSLLGFIVILCFVGTLLFNTPLPGANGISTFFSAILLCSILGLSAAILTDLIIARRNSRDYRRRQQVAHQP